MDKIQNTENLADAEIVDYVDENDTVLGQATRKEIRDKNLGAVRVASILLFDEQHNVILGKMAERKGKGKAGRYTFTSSGHALAGEKMPDAAVRELFEEQGAELNPNALHLQMKILTRGENNVPKRIRYIYFAACSQDLIPNAHEYQSNHFFTTENLFVFLKNGRKNFYESFANDMQKIMENYKAHHKAFSRVVTELYPEKTGKRPHLEGNSKKLSAALLESVIKMIHEKRGAESSRASGIIPSKEGR